MIAACLLALVPHGQPVTDRVVIEVNSTYDNRGRLVLEQVIFWEFSDRGYRVVAWQLLKSKFQRPVNGVAAWVDGNRLRVVRTSQVKFTWTQHDPEIIDRKRWPVAARRGLSR